MHLYIVTGATKGLGRALADALERETNHEVITLSRAGEEIQGRCRNYFLDLAQPESIAALLQRALATCSQPRYDKVVLINNGGMLEPVGMLADCNTAALEANLKVNLLAPMILMQQFIANTRTLSDVRLVINISSGAGMRPKVGWSAYCVAKAGLNMASRVAALEAKRNEPGLIICSLDPGVIDTQMQEQIRAKTEGEFPEVERFRQMKLQGALRPADGVAAQILKLERSDAFQNGVIHDIREMEESGECSAPKEAGNAARTGEARNGEERNEEARK